MPFPKMNATMYIWNSSLSTAADFTFPLLILSIILVAGFLMLVYGNFSRYKKLMGLFGFLGRTCIYFGKGLIGIVVFTAVYFVILLLGTSIQSGAIDIIELLKWIGICIGGFFGIAILGYVLDRYLWRRITSFNKRYKKEKKKS